MSTFEKIASILIAILLLGAIVFSFREISEPREQPKGSREMSHFDQTIGQDFKIGPFATMVSKTASKEVEQNCAPLQPIIIAALHDIRVRLQTDAFFTQSDSKNTFEVNQDTLKLFCQKTAEITLTDSAGNKLILQKVPFIRTIPENGTTDDIGTQVRINATLVAVGGATPSKPTTFGIQLIPDRFLDSTSSTAL